MKSKNQNKILKYIYPDKQIKSTELIDIFGVKHTDASIAELAREQLIRYDNKESHNDPSILLTEKGRAEVENALNDNRRFWIPIVVSNVIATAALIVAILSYIKQ